MATGAATDAKYYELYRRSSLGGALTDTLDSLITERRIEPQLAMKILANFDKAVADVLAEKVKARLTFKGHLDTYRFCDDVWTFIIKDINFKLDNTNQVHADRVKIVSCNTKRPDCPRFCDRIIHRNYCPNLRGLRGRRKNYKYSVKDALRDPADPDFDKAILDKNFDYNDYNFEWET